MQHIISNQLVRPTIIIVLVILGYIVIGNSVINTVWQYFNLKTSVEMVSPEMRNSKTVNQSDGYIKSLRMDGELEFLSNTTKWLPLITLVSILSAMVCLWGTLLIWKLKKIGFLLFVTGEIVPVVLITILNGAGSIFSSFYGTVNLVMAFIVIILFGMNLRYLSI